MRFIVQLLDNLLKDRSCEFSDAVTHAYQAMLKPYHGWLSSSAFAVRI